MPRQSKTPLYDAFNESPLCFGTHGKEARLWRTLLDPELPITLELGCGRAEMSLFLAQKYPEDNFLGVDLKADRLWRACQQAQALKLDNIAFIQSDILNLGDFIMPGTVHRIWLTHPDPFPKDRQAKHRMLNHNFLDIYKKAMQPGGTIRFKTDSRAFFDWALELLNAQADVEVGQTMTDLHEESTDEELLVETAFTRKHRAKGTKINYLEFWFR